MASEEGSEGAKVLVVDDEPAIAELQKTMLGRRGYEVVAFNDPARALEAFERDPAGFDLVITDMTMPGMTGDTLAARVREVSPTVAIIVCTGFSEKMDQEKAEAIGVDMLLSKPVDSLRLEKSVREAIRRRRSRAR